MANPEHLVVLEQGVNIWNEWRKENPWIKPDLNKAVLKGLNLRLIDVSSTDLRGADLTGAVLNHADFSHARLREADLSDAVLIEARLVSAEGNNATLINTNFRDANLNHANFSGATLNGANLVRAQALNTNFEGANLTGICIEDWHIDTRTRLQGVACHYIFRGYNPAERLYCNRRPHDSSKTFAPGDLAKLVQKSLDTVDLIFREGVDWRAFAYSFNQLEVQYGNDQLSIHSIENQGDGTVVVKLNAAPNLNKTELDQSFWKGFEKAQILLSGQHEILSSQYEARLVDKDGQINLLFHQWQESQVQIRHLQDQLGEVSKLMSKQSKTTIFQPGAKIVNQAVDRGVAISGQFNDYSTQQDLAAAAQDIQSLLNQLSQTYPSTTIPEQATLAAKALEEIEKNPPLKARVIGALKAGGVEALKELVDHPAVAIVLAALEGWQKPE